MDKPRRVISLKSSYSFSLGLDQETLRKLKELQVDTLFTLKGERQPSRTLIARAAIQFRGIGQTILRTTMVRDTHSKQCLIGLKKSRSRNEKEIFNSARFQFHLGAQTYLMM